MEAPWIKAVSFYTFRKIRYTFLIFQCLKLNQVGPCYMLTRHLWQRYKFLLRVSCVRSIEPTELKLSKAHKRTFLIAFITNFSSGMKMFFLLQLLLNFAAHATSPLCPPFCETLSSTFVFQLETDLRNELRSRSYISWVKKEKFPSSSKYEIHILFKQNKSLIHSTHVWGQVHQPPIHLTASPPPCPTGHFSASICI